MSQLLATGTRVVYDTTDDMTLDQAKQAARDELGGEVGNLASRVAAAELLITPAAIVSTVTSSTTYLADRQQVYADMESLLGYRLEITAGTVFLSENVRSTTLTARVWHGNEDVTDTIPASRFQWRRQSEDSMADTVWNDAHQGLKSVLVSTADVLRQASFCCELIDR